MGTPSDGRSGRKSRKVNLDKLYSYMDERSMEGYLQSWESEVPEMPDDHDRTPEMPKSEDDSELWPDENGE
jgi:hypothetical protein